MAISDDKNTNLLNDELSRSRTGITLRGTAKGDEIKGTSRNDVLDGGAGSDTVDAGSGNDLLIYRLSENTGARDRYDGGSGIDTLRLEFTAAEWARADVRADITRFLAVLQKVTVRGEETEGNSNWFSFKAFGLEVRKIELLEIRVDGVVVDPLGNTSPAPVANADVANVAEGAAVSGNVLANDQATNATVSLVNNVTRGTLVLNANGSYTFTAGPAFDALAAGQSTTETFTYRITDAQGRTATAGVTITVAGTNDAAVITGTSTASLTETNAAQSASGQLNVTDVDGAASFVAQSGTAGQYGSFSINAAGAWTYTMGSAHDEFVAGQNYSDSFTVATADGTTQVITVTIAGTNDAAVITGTSTASLTETNAAQSASGQLNVTDVDGAASFVAQSGAAGQYGSFSINATGAWTYTMDAAHDEFVAGQNYTDSFTVATADGTQQVITVTIAGTNDAAIITGTSTASLTETNAVQSASGQLNVTDVDSAASFVAQSGAVGQYGSFSINATGAWTYTMGSAHDEFVAGQTYSDSFTVATADGTTQVVTVNIAGTNDAAVISGFFTGSIETDAPLTITGKLDVTDIDGPDAFVAQSGIAGINGLGSFAIDASGNWTFVANSAFDGLALGQYIYDYAEVSTADGTTLFVSITINGTNDGPVITGGAQTGSVTEDITLTASGQLSAEDVDAGAILTWSVQGAATGSYGSLALDANTGAWTYTLDNANHQDLAAGESHVEVFTVRATDEHGATADQTVNVTVNGTNDAAVISGFFTGSIETDAPLTITGKLDVVDIDGPDVFVAQSGIAGINGLGSFAIDASGNWTFVANSAFDGLAVGQYIYDYAEVSAADGTKQFISIAINGSNDGPVISGGVATGVVAEDGVAEATGQLLATDPDAGAQQLWTVEGGTPAGNADFLFKVDSLTITRNGTTIFQDTFGDGIAPPVGPDGVTESYGGVGSVQLTESGGKLLLDSDGVQSFVGIANSDPTVGVNAIVKTNINPANLGSGLKSTANFSASAVFDLILPDSSRENYGLRFSDRLVGGNGTPPDQLGDNVVDFRVTQQVDGALVVRLQQRSFVADTKETLESVALDAPVGADQIRMNLTHSTTQVGVVVASFDYLAAGSVVGSYTFTATGTIFEGENFTRAEIIASAPAVNDSAIGGTYGTLNVDQTGTWTYTLNDGLATTQSLAAGQTAFDTFTLQVTDEHGASDTETVTITVTGSNDTPEVQTGTVSRALTEDAAPSLTASGAGQFADVDLNDTHTVAAVLTSAGLNNSATLPAGLQALLADAVAVTLADVATGDAHGQYEWDFALANSAVQFLAAGQTLTLAYDITVTDNHGAAATQRVNVTINGTNDGAVITGDSTASLTETNAVQSTSGQLNVTDVDGAASFIIQSGTVGQYGSFSIDATGAWTYTMGSAHDEFVGGQTYSESFTVATADGTTQSVNITIAGSNDAAVISGASPAGQSVIDLGGYGKLIAPVQVDGGKWFYYWDRSGDGTSNNNGVLNGGIDQTTHDVLDGIFNQDINGVVGGSGDTTDTYRYATLNGVRVALPTAGGQSTPPYGAAGIGGYQPGTTVGSSPETTGSNAVNPTYNDLLAVWDAYNGTGTGSFTNGTPSDWLVYGYLSATPSASGHALPSLFVGQVFDYADSNSGAVALQVLSGSDGTAITETNVAQAVSGQLTATDVDSPASFVAQTNVAGSSGYGSFSINATGAWAYTMGSAHDEFVAGQTYSDTFTVATADGTTQVVTVNLTGTNDGAVITGDSTASITESNVAQSASGQLNVSDIDSAETVVAQTGTAGQYGSFSIDATGAWTYTMGSAHDEFVAGQTYSDSFTVATADGATQVVTVAINGTNDGPVAVDDSITATEDTAFSSVVSLIANDTDVDGPTKTAVEGAFTTQQGGTLVLAADGSYTYTPPVNFNGIDAVDYTVTDGTLSDIGTLLITVTAVNDAPVAVDDSITATEDTAFTSVVSLIANDAEVDGEAKTAVEGTFTTEQGGTLVLAADGSYTYTPPVNFNGIDAVNYTVTDGTLSDIGTLTITVNAVNDAPVAVDDSITATEDTAFSSVVSLIANDTDVDGPTKTAVAGTFTTVAGGTLVLATDGSYTYTPALNFTGTDTVDYTVTDGTMSDIGTLTINVNAVNDVPVITGATQSGAVTEDVADIATGQLTATDPDTGARQFWTVEGGTPAGNADFLFKVDSLTVTRNATTIFQDNFSDGIAPPSGPNGASSYAGVGSVQLTESGGKLLLDSDGAQSFVGIANSDPTVGVNAIAKTNINPASTNSGLKSTANFTASAVFDLILPDSPRENYGLRFTDRLVGGDGTPPDQLGDNVVDFRVSMREDGSLAVRLQQRSFVADTKLLLEAVALTPPVGADQIRLNLAHATAHVGQVVASFDYLASGSVVGSYTFAATGTIFQGENFTRAEIIASAPAINDSAIGGTYGTLNVDQTGTWTYTLNDGLATTQSLAAGQTAFDTFTLQVTDENGASDSETVTITVTGTNDTPEVQTGTVSRTLTEDAAASLTASGAGQFADVDVNDTHTVVAVLTSAGLSNSATLPAGLQALLADAVAVTLPDVATGDAHGQYEWDFALANSAVQFLAAGQTLTLAYDIAVTDNHGAAATQRVNVTINGTNDGAVITGSSTASLTETNAPLSASGTLSASDVDSSAAFVAQTNVSGSNGYGVFSINAAGAWTYSAAAHNEFVGGQSYTDSVTVATADGTQQVITVMIAGTNDAAVITGSSTASLTETNAPLSASGTLSASDVDSSAAFVAQTNVSGSNGYGVFSINAAGAWTYSAAAHNEFVHGQSYTDSISVASVDGTSQVITVTIVGTNDAAVLSSATVSLTETNAAADISTSGTLLISDIDSPASFVAQAGTHGSYGTFALNAAGAWTYTADSAHNEFVAGTTYTDTFAVTSTDGTTTAVNIHILGTEDNRAPVAPDVTLRVNQLGNGGFDATPDFSGWHVTTTLSGMTSGTTSAIINRGGTLIPGDNAVAVLALDGIVPIGFGTGYGAAITSDAFHGEAGDQVRFVYELHAGSDQAKGTGYIRDANTHAIVQTIFDYLVPIVGSTGVQTVNLTLASSGDYTLDFRVGSYDATGGTVIGATLELGFAGILRSGLLEDTPFTFAGSTFLSGVTDADGDTTTLLSVTPTSTNGASVVLSGGNVTYNPTGAFDYLAANQELIDTFQFTVSDGRGGFDTATANIKVVGVNDAPVVTSAATASFAENGTGIAYTATATDVDSAVLSYSLGGTDAALFNINATTGAVTFKTTPNYEIPADAGGNNVYDITVSASDGINTSAAKAVAISVTDVAENRAPTLGMGGDGKAIIPVGGYDIGYGTALQSDGKIVLVGQSELDSGGEYFQQGVVRLNVDGSLDSSFGAAGKVFFRLSTYDESAFDVTLQADGKILVAGCSTNVDSSDYSLIRLNANGSLDTSFDGDGKAIIPVGAMDDVGQTIALQADGKILVAGYSYVGNNHDYSLIRLNANGSLDTSFDGDGKAIIPVGTSYDYVQTMVLQADGKILVAGSSLNGDNYDYSLIRLNANGSLDTSFDGDGKAIIPVGTSNDYGSSMALQSDGKILVAGYSNVSSGNADYSVIRLNANGSLDTSFDGDGKVIIPVGTSFDIGTTMALQSDGKILVAGYTNVSDVNNHDYSVIRLNANGSLDTSFDGDGKAIIPVGTFDDLVESMKLQADGKIVVSGSSLNGNGYDYSVIRLNANGSLDTSFGNSAPVAYVENAAPVVLNGLATVFDADLVVAGNYAGASITLARSAGANAQDRFSGSGTLGALIEGAGFTVGGTTIGAVTHNSGGSLTLTFDSNATQALVNAALQQIAYANASDAPPASVTIDWLFSDGNSGVQGSGGALTASGSTTVLITAVNDAPVVTSAATASFAENATGTVYTATATDADSAVLSYTIGGSDAALFNIDAVTGAVRFKNAPNYEAPADAGGNNVYDITVSASDGVNSSAAQGVAISVTDVLESLAGQSVIDLGSFGKLIAPVQVDGGKWYYYWDRSGNGTSANTGTLNGGVDYTTHDVLDGIFNRDINGVVGGGGNTTDTYRYATLNGVQVALPTAGGQSSPPYGSGGIGNYQPGTTIGTSPATTGSNAVNATYNDLLAVWDAYNGTGTGTPVNGTPSGWQADYYWSATPSASGHAYVVLSSSFVVGYTDDGGTGYVALQVL